MNSNWNATLPGVEHGFRNPYKVVAVCLLLLLSVGLVFGQTLHHEFVNYDDGEYVYENPQVVRGLTSEGIGWAFTHAHASNWHPLTWISHMLDCEVYGLSPWGHHLTNVLLHAATAILLFLVLLRMTGRFFPSAFVALVFAIHPLRAESVAWVAERKDVLSGLFFMLTLGAYVEYVRHPFSFVRYLAVFLAFAFGLMAKPMLVTLPFVLLLLDYWPLGRMEKPALEALHAPRFGRVSGPPSVVRLLVEKLPLLALVIASSMATLWAQRGAMEPGEALPLLSRLGNALVSYVAYLGKLFYPVSLAVFYPHPVFDLPVWKIVGAALLLVGITVGAVAWRRNHPYLLVGWLWYLGTLLPVIGLVQVGSQAMADRYTYLTQIGLLIALTWGVAQACGSWRHGRWVCGVTSVFIVIALMGCAWRQTSFWHDSETLWTHTLDCTPVNVVAHNFLGRALVREGRMDEGIRHFREALRFNPDYDDAHNNLAVALVAQGEGSEAISHYERALEFKPNSAVIHNNLGIALAGLKRIDEAIEHYKVALNLQPEYAEAHSNLGDALASRGQLREAIQHYEKALALNRDYVPARNNLGVALANLGRFEEAITQYQMALKLAPNIASTHVNLGEALVNRGRLVQAVTHFRKALELQPNIAAVHWQLGNALARQGGGDEAIIHFQKSLELQPDFPEAHCQLANLLVRRQRIDEAIEHYHEALKLNPNLLEAHNNLAWLRATWPQASFRNGAEAIELALKAVQLSGGEEPDILDTLAAAYAEAGRFSKAQEIAQKALALALQQNKQALAEALRARLSLYEAGTPFRSES